MTFRVKFSEQGGSFRARFGAVQTASDGGYEQGYGEGYEAGNAEGYTKGYEEGLQAGGEAEGMYELLDTITLAEEAAEVVIDKYTDGTNLNLKKAYVVLNLPKVTKTFWVTLHINYKYNKNIGQTFGNTGYNTIYDFEAVIDGGLLSLGYAYHTNHVNNSGTWNTVVRKLTEKISALIFTGDTFPVGTKFEIYGVKAQ